MASSGVVNSDSWNSAKYQFSWTQTIVEPGISKVSWQLHGTGRSSSPTQYYAKCRLYINGKKVYENWDVSTSFKTGSSAKASGTFQINHNTNGEGSFKVWLNVTKIYDVVTDYGTKTISLEKNYPYTTCGAPTIINASGIITPNGSFTVDWSGAANGVANDIIKYRVYYNVSSGGTAPTTSTTTYKDVTVTKGTTSGSCTITLSNAIRGNKVVCGIKAFGEAEGYDSELKTGGLVTINSLPDAPAVSVSKTVVPSSNGEVIFTVSAGSDKDTIQTKTLYYSNSTSGNKTPFASPLVIKVTATTTYYFWTYDGLEFSKSSTSKTIIKNTKPAVSVSVTGSNLQSANKNALYNYIIAPSINISSSGGQFNKKYDYYIDYGPSTSLGSRKVISTSETSATKAIPDIRIYGLEHENNGAFYKITVKCNDGIEDSAEISSDIYYITKIPNLEYISNSPNFTNISGFYTGTKATHFSKFLGFRFQRDEGYNILRISGYPSSNSQVNITLTTTDFYTQGEFINSNVLAASQGYSFGLEIGNSSGYFGSKVTQNLIKIGSVSLNNFNFALTNSSFKFFTDSNKTYQSSLGHSFGVTPTSNPTNLKDFGIVSNEYFYAKIESNNAQTAEIIPTINSSTNDNTLVFNLTSNQLVDAIKPIFSIPQRNFIYSATLKFTIRNAFGEETTVQQDFKIDFKETVTLMEYSIYPSKYLSYPINQWKFLKEGMELLGTFKVKSYNTEVKGQIDIKRDEADWQTLVKLTFTKSETTEASPDNPATYNVSGVSIQNIGEITRSSYQVSYRIVLNSEADISSIFSLYDNLEIRGHKAPVFNILSTEFANSTLKVNYNFLDMGLSTNETDPSIKDNKIYLYIKNSDLSYSSLINTSDYFNNTEKTNWFADFDFQGKDSLMGILSATTQLSAKTKDELVEDYISLKTSNININTAQYVVIYNVTPTVAYRKNYLGINTASPESQSKAIILIGETAGRDSIYFQSANGNLCKIENFCINGGTW